MWILCESKCIMCPPVFGRTKQLHQKLNKVTLDFSFAKNFELRFADDWAMAITIAYMLAI